MVLKLYGIAQSTCTRRVRVVLEELKVPYELVLVEWSKGEHKSAAFMAIQPFGQVPYIDDDGFKLFESRAIARYLAIKYGGLGTLIPAPDDTHKIALFEQAASIEFSNFNPSAEGLATENIFKQLRGEETDPQMVEMHKATLEAKLEGYEAMLSKYKYLAGDEVTLADLFHLPYGNLLKVQGYDYLESGKYPNVTRWWKDIASRPSWVRVMAL